MGLASVAARSFSAPPRDQPPSVHHAGISVWSGNDGAAARKPMPAGFCGGLESFLMPSFSSELSKIHSFSFALAIPRLSHLTKKPKSDSGRPDNASIAAAKVAEGARSTVKPAGHRAEFRNFVQPGWFRWPYQLRPLKGPDGLVEASNPEFDQESLMLETQQVLVDLEQVVFFIGM